MSMNKKGKGDVGQNSLVGIQQKLKKVEEMPGPGHYQLNIPAQIKVLNDKMAPRYH